MFREFRGIEPADLAAHLPGVGDDQHQSFPPLPQSLAKVRKFRGATAGHEKPVPQFQPWHGTELQTETRGYPSRKTLIAGAAGQVDRLGAILPGKRFDDVIGGDQAFGGQNFAQRGVDAAL